ncbi:MAG TPA: hypothetical protein VFS23_32720 [Vicinamibacterales bacterium]|nr:hypothetical protein [Vicinamibacterales bacterium]
MAAETGPETNLKSLAIACTLTAGDLQKRLAQIRKLTAEALLGHDRNGLVLALRYAPEAVEGVRAMVASEQHCCAFLNFEVREQPDVVHVTITAPENAREAADELFEQFIAADGANQ